MSTYEMGQKEYSMAILKLKLTLREYQECEFNQKAKFSSDSTN